MAADIPYDREFAVTHGLVEQVSPLIRRVVAANSGPFTFHGTGTYIIGRGQVAVIDPGPRLDAHVEALLTELQGEEITHLLVTHTHLDHSPACQDIQAQMSVPTYAFGPHGGGQFEVGKQVEAGADWAFKPDVKVNHGDVIEGAGWSMECVFTPGHTTNHMCFQLREEQALFSGDHVMGWSTTIIAPPDGEMRTYLDSLELLLEREDKVYWPTHGGPIKEPQSYVRAVIAHRHQRESEILACVKRGNDTIDEMVPIIYHDLPEAMHSAAARMVFATVIYLIETERLLCADQLAIDARFSLPKNSY